MQASPNMYRFSLKSILVQSQSGVDNFLSDAISEFQTL